MPKKQSVHLEPAVALVGYASPHGGTIEFIEQFEIRQAQLINPSPLKLRVAMQMAKYALSNKDVRRFPGFTGKTPEGRRILWVESESIGWRIEEGSWVDIKFQQSEELFTFKLHTRGMEFAVDRYAKLEWHYDTPAGKLSMPMPNTNSAGALCTGNIFDHYRVRGDIADTIWDVERMLFMALYTELRAAVPISIEWLAWMTKLHERNKTPSLKENIAMIRKLYRAHGLKPPINVEDTNELAGPA